MGFKSAMEHFGHDLKVGVVDIGKAIEKALPYAETFGSAAVGMFLPALSPLFNKVLGEVITAEQNWTAAGKANGTGAQKSAAVLAIVGNLIEQGLKDAGLAATAADIQKYVDMVVLFLNVTPAPVTPTAVDLQAQA